MNPEEIHLEEFSRGAIGISIGLKQRHWHLEQNKDEGILLTFVDKILVAVCDGHHGAQSSEVVFDTKTYETHLNLKEQKFNSILIQKRKG